MSAEDAPPGDEIERLTRMLSEQTRFDRAILDGVDVGIVTTDADGAVTFMNRTAQHLLHRESDSVGASVTALFGLRDRPSKLLGIEIRRSLRHALSREGVELDLELSITRADDALGFFFIFRDVREEKMQEAERRRFEHLAAMGTMVAGFAHEVRNPVAAMRSIAEELEEELRDRNVEVPHVGMLLQMVERIERLVKTSLQFGRPAAPKRALHRPWTIASSAITELRALRTGGEDIRLEAEPELPTINVDERQITQVLVILLTNALDAAGSPSKVHLRLRRSRAPEREGASTRKSDPPQVPAVRFEVIDHGPGISAENLARIFDPFFTTKAAGTGLGLSIAQQLVNDNGARLEVLSTPGSITSFSIVVPLGVAPS